MADNGLNSTANASAILDVQCKRLSKRVLILQKQEVPQLFVILISQYYLLSDIDVPGLTTKPSNKTIIENQEVTFRCAATGNPTPNIKWIKDGNPLGNEDILSFKAKRGDSGKYWCTAENGLDVTVNSSAYLDVQCKLSRTLHYLKVHITEFLFT